MQDQGFWRLRPGVFLVPLGSAWVPLGLCDGTARRISTALHQGRLGFYPELHSQQPRHGCWAIPPPVLWTEAPPSPSTKPMWGAECGPWDHLCVILICETAGEDAARTPNLTYGLATSVMHAPSPRLPPTEFPKSESSPAPAEPVPGGMGEGRARI